MKKRASKGIHSSHAPLQATKAKVGSTSVSTDGQEDDEVHAGNVRRFTPSAPEPRDDRRPGAFYSDGRDARDITGIDTWSASEVSDLDCEAADLNLDLDLVSADVVDPDETKRIVERELAERQRNTAVAEVVTGFWCSKRVKIIGALGLMVVITAVVLGTVLPRVLEPPEPTSAPTAAPTAPLPFLTDKISSVSPDGGVALQDSSTPQNDALTWLVNNTFLNMYSFEKKIQRYVLATLYYSTNGNNWRHNTLWLTDDDECGWYTQADQSLCAGGAIMELDLYVSASNNLVGTIPNEIALLSNSLGTFFLHILSETRQINILTILLFSLSQRS